jgi:predicted Zn-dependent peptidase
MEKESYNYHTLPNGIRLIHKQVSSPICHVGLVVNTGTRDERKEENGMAHFIEHIIFKGTKKRNTYQVLSYLENVGGDLNAYTTKEETFFYASVLNTYLGRALELLCDIVFNSSFNTKDIETEKDVVIEEIKSYQDNPSEAIFDEFENLIFDGHPLGTNILGTKKSVKSFTQKKINEFIKQNYHTDQMVIAIVGNVSFNKCIALTEKHAGVISENMRNIQRQAFTQYSVLSKTKRIHGLQAHAMIGRALPHYDEKKNQTAVLLNNILGGPGLNSRLNLAIREKNGYVYNNESSYAALSDAGIFSVYAASDTKNIERKTDLIYKEMHKLQTLKLGTLQLHRTHLQLIGQTCITYESNLNEMLSIGKNHLIYKEVEPIDCIIKRIESITASDLIELARDLFNKESLSTLLFKK